MTRENLTPTDVAFTAAAATFAVVGIIQVAAGWELLGMMYSILAIALATFVQVDRNRRQTREIVNLLKKWPGRPDLPRSNDTTAAELPGDR